MNNLPTKTIEGRIVSQSRKVVPSPYWRQGFNPNFPFGCSSELNEEIQVISNPTIATPTKVSCDSIRIRNREALKKAKSECVNKKNLTTIFKTY